MLRSLRASMIVTLLVLTAAFTTGCNNTPAVQVSGAAGTEPVELLRQVGGSDAAFDKVGGVLINSADATKADLTALAVNFETESVIVVTLGEVPTAGYGVTITGVQKAGDKIFVQFKTAQPAADAVTAQVISHPYAAVAVPKLTGTLHLEESN